MERFLLRLPFSDEWGDGERCLSLIFSFTMTSRTFFASSTRRSSSAMSSGSSGFLRGGCEAAACGGLAAIVGGDGTRLRSRWFLAELFDDERRRNERLLKKLFNKNFHLKLFELTGFVTSTWICCGYDDPVSVASDCRRSGCCVGCCPIVGCR